MKIMIRTILAGAMGLTIGLSGCSSSGGITGLDDEKTRTIAGTVIGGVVGHQFGKGRGRKLATVAGAVLGGYLAGAMSPYSRQRTNYALERAPNNSASTWTDPESNNQYTVTPTSTYNANIGGQNRKCRTYTMDAYIDGRMQQVKGKACRNANGQWISQS